MNNNNRNMKKIYTFIAVLFIAASVFGQAPASFKYQAVLRDARGNIRANTSTNIIISILSGSATGTTVYSETFSTKTDGYGLVNLEIGNGTPTVGTMSGIDWSAGTYFVKTTVDGVDMGTNQLLSVPYAQYANRAANGMSKADSAKLAGIAPGAEVNVNADWNAVSGDAQILNKPTIVNPVNADWNASTGSAQILNKPTLVNADWNASTGLAQILNKPTIPTVNGSETKVTGSATVTVTGTGTATTPYVIKTTANTIHTIGESYGGGIVFYVYDGGLHGLIAATSDLVWYPEVPDQYWQWNNLYCPEGCDYFESGATGDGLGAGAMNTAIIVGSQSGYITFYNYYFWAGISMQGFAAKGCTDYTVTVGDTATYGSWYLPSLYELNLLYLSLGKTQEFLNILQGPEDYYWSSTEIDEYSANLFYFFDGSQDYDNKEYGYFVRPIRAF